MDLRIKNQQYTFTPIKKVSTKDGFQEQINTLQEQLNKCTREITALDAYHIVTSVDDLDNLESTLSHLVPGEACVINAPSTAEYKMGDIIIKKSAIETIHVNAFDTGVYYPSKVEKNTTTGNIEVTYKFSQNAPSDKEDSEPKESYTFTIPTPDNNVLYYSFGGSTNESEDLITGASVTIQGAANKALTSRPIIRFYYYPDTTKEDKEEILLSYKMTATTSGNITNYTVTPESVPANGRTVMVVK